MKYEPVLVLFAKKPIEGEVKTRLCPPLSPIQAKQVAILLIEQSVKNACEHWPGPVELCLWPDTDDDFMRKLSKQYMFDLTTQSHGDLGDKMAATMSVKMAVNQVALIMGCDVLNCSRDILLEAFNALKTGKNVIGPTIDGGYYCVGVNRPEDKMFNDVNWGSDRAFKQTVDSCSSCGIEFDSILPQLRDLDTYDDLLVLSRQYPILESFLI